MQTKYKYNPWPLGKLPIELQRKEPDLIREMGYKWDDPRDIVDIFERKLADFWNSPYAVAVDCCSHALFLCLKYTQTKRVLSTITIPKQTYCSVPMQIENAGLKVKFETHFWEGFYALRPTNIIDAAVVWQRGGYMSGKLMCLSFQIKKMIPVGKMGAILTDDPEAYKWLKLASYDGRDLTTPYDSKGHIKMTGYHFYATPEDCARAIILMDLVKTEGCYMGSEDYPDLSEML
jgi:dTDP-4-amino-4,6-dideoxygalactose transaminase